MCSDPEDPTQQCDGYSDSQNQIQVYKGNLPDPHKQTSENITLTSRILKGDLDALGELLIPSHFGFRIQGEGSLGIGGVFGLSGSLGLNIVYNRYSDELASNVDWAIEPGVGVGYGGSIVGGPLIGWLSSDVSDVTEGGSAILSGTAATGQAVAVALTAPLDDQGLHVDPYSGQTPVTLFIGGGGGAGYGGIGVGYNGQTGFHWDLTSWLPWR